MPAQGQRVGAPRASKLRSCWVRCSARGEALVGLGEARRRWLACARRAGRSWDGVMRPPLAAKHICCSSRPCRTFQSLVVCADGTARRALLQHKGSRPQALCLHALSQRGPHRSVLARRSRAAPTAPEAGQHGGCPRQPEAAAPRLWGWSPLERPRQARAPWRVQRARLCCRSDRPQPLPCDAPPLHRDHGVVPHLTRPEALGCGAWVAAGGQAQVHPSANKACLRRRSISTALVVPCCTSLPCLWLVEITRCDV
jgi:hypothetical protein